MRRSPGAVLALALLLWLPRAAVAQSDSPRYDPAWHGALAAGGFIGAGLIVWAERDDALACNWCGVGPNGTPEAPRLDGWARSRWRWDKEGRAATISHLTASAAYAWPLVALTAVHDGTGGEWGRDQLAALSSLGIAQFAADVTKRAFRRARPGVVFDGQPVSGRDDVHSFISGHTATTFAAVVAAGTIASRRQSQDAPWIWAAGVGAARGRRGPFGHHRSDGLQMITRRRFLSTVPGALVAGSQRASAQPRQAITGVWMGGVTPQGVTVTVLTSAPDVPVTLTMPASATPALEQTVPANADGVAVFALTGLAPRTRYRYAVSAAGGPALDGSFRTFADGPFSFRLLFASCASTGSSNPVFTAMRQLQPDLFIHLGDLHYENISRNDVLRFRQAYTKVLGSPTQSALFRNVPFDYIWDDHDYGPNNSDRRSPSRPAAWQAYRRFIPHYPLAEPADAPVHHAFTIGRVRVLVTDTRSERAPERLPEPQRTMLGPAQLAWLERELEAARSAPLVVLVNTVPWITKANESTGDGWAKYARERRHIADLIVRFGLTRKLVMLSGDGHMLAMDDGTNSQYSTLPEAPARGFVIAHAAPLDRRPTNKGGPHSHGQVARNNQFGVMDVTDDGGPITVRLRGMRLGAPVPGMEMELTV